MEKFNVFIDIVKMNVGGRRAKKIYTPKFSFWNSTKNSWLASSIPNSSLQKYILRHINRKTPQHSGLFASFFALTNTPVFFWN